ncbi:MAG: tetratricopeptide repeat protein [Myxococcales bacterium]
MTAAPKPGSNTLVRNILSATALSLGLGAAQSAEAVPHCPTGQWMSQGSCCEVGSEYVPSKNQCMPVRAERRCVAGHLDDCVAAGRDLETRGNSGASYSAELYRYACEEGYAPACRGLGSLYYRGLGIERDEARGRVLFEESCDGGDAVGCTVLAKLLLEEGQDTFRALELLTQACHRGDLEACDFYGRRISSDPAHFAESAHYLERACEGGRGNACRSLVELERSHETFTPEREHALLELACKASDGEACMQLGDALKRDPVRAAELFGKACGAGVTLACERVASLRLEQAQARSASRGP